MSRPGADSPRLQIKRDGGSGTWRVSLHGVLDESFDRRAFSGLSGIIIFDFEAVNRVTSFGVLEWIKALKDLQADYYAFINCHPAVVGEFNMVENFAGRGELLTFYVPYICPQCERESEVLVSMRTQYDQVVANQLTPVYCPDDNAESELDDYPARYFAYASSRPRPAPPQMAVQIIDGQQPAGPQHLSVRKEVDGHVTTLRLSGPVEGKVPGKRLFEGLEGYVVIDMSEVTEISPPGMSKLRDAARMALSPPLYFARLSSNLLQSFQTAASDALLVSLICDIRCATCARYFPVEVDRMASSVGAYMSPTRCPDCQVVIPASHAAKIANALAEPLSPAPPAIMAHLRQREAPKPEAPVMPAVPALPVQQAVQSDSMNRYERIRRIGVGGMAEVFLAQRTGPHGFRKTVVLKRMLPDIARQPRLAQMFLQEARIAALINHPNVVQIFELGQEDEGLFMVMEYVDGWDLGAVISAADRARRTMPLALCCRIVADLCAGLHAAHTTSDESGHRLGIVHRDVSPSNVLIATDGAVKLVDFGIAKVQDSFIHTQPGALKGKLSYMAPEQMLAAEDEIGPQTDMFGVGVILFECLTGRRPFVGRTEYELMQSILHHEAPKLRSLRSDAPKSLERLVERLLARNAAQRCKDAGEIVVELERMLVELKTPTVIRDVAEWVHCLPALAAQKASAKVEPDAATRRGDAAIRRGDAAIRRGDGPPVAQGKKRAPTTLALDESELEFEPEGRLDGKH